MPCELGDFGFTQEFEWGAFMETFCGTTGYAAPEMLQGKQYQGPGKLTWLSCCLIANPRPEVDVWSLGVILCSSLTGTLPFDNDDEALMREKIIEGDFEDPMWLSIGKSILVRWILMRECRQFLL